MFIQILPFGLVVFRRQFRQCTVDRTNVWRPSDGAYNWPHFENAVRRAVDIANDLRCSQR